MIGDLFIAVLFVVSFHRLFSVASGVDCVRSGRVSMVRRFLVLSSLVIFCSFTVMSSRMGMML